ncbi:MAG: sigma-70 family RNA polymerase sigma factor [Acidocella sp.]|nr:sigma-70 family RNA polymerase sigma factor [Acidocella sp.]
MNEADRLELAIPALRRYARVLTRDSVAADDLVQDCLVRALPKLATVRDGNDLRPWLFTILRNLHISRWRRLKRTLAVSLKYPETGVQPAAQEARSDLYDVLRILFQLPEEQREIMMMVAVEDMEYGVIAEVLGIPIGTVMSRLSRGRAALRANFDGKASRPVLRRVK